MGKRTISHNQSAQLAKSQDIQAMWASWLARKETEKMASDRLMCISYSENEFDWQESAKRFTRFTGNLESYHSLCKKFCPKQMCFSMYGMISRTMIAVLDHNCIAKLPQATTFDGTLRYKQVFSKISGGWL